MDQKIVDYYQKQMDDIESLKKDRSVKLIELVKHITTISLGMLTILIAFKKNIEIPKNDILFSAVIILIGSTVIFGIFYVYHIVNELNQIIRFQSESLIKRMNGNFKEIYQHRTVTKWYFTVSKYIFYISAFLSVILLVIYGILI